VRILAAAALYFLAGFACGFGLGAVRTFLLEPRLGATLATLIELPIILGLLWRICPWAMGRAGMPDTAVARAAMGAIWLALLLTAEFALGVLMRGWTPGQVLAHFATPQGAMGLAGFVLAAFFPLLAPQRKFAA